MKLRVENVCWSVDHQPILQEICLEVQAGTFVGIIGPNGSGKSTLLRCVYRALKPHAGSIHLDECNLFSLSPRKSAQRMAVVLQEMPTQFDFTVREMVAMGRTPHKTMFESDTAEDHGIVESALGQVKMLHCAERNFSTLSGGEKQRVLIARALAQQTDFLVLDEPTNHLDIRYQLEVLELVKTLGMTTLAALHDLNLAAYYCDLLYVLNAGQVVASGTPEAVLTETMIRDVYGVSAEVIPHPRTGKLQVTYFPSALDAKVGA